MGNSKASSPQSTETNTNVIADAFTRALDCATEFVGATAPNPPVGCAVLDAAGEILTVAAHQKAGQPHAEALAIAQCRQNGTLDHIHTIVVTLEPCNHTGRTPPCAQAILNTQARVVWIGVKDPNPQVAGGGAEALAQAGLAVRFIDDLDHPQAAKLKSAAERLIGPFAKRMRAGLPWVTIKQALDRTGSMIPPKGAKTFTSKSSLTLAHQLRKRADAILTGSGTILADDPAFTVRRVPDFEGKQRALVILDRRQRVPETYLAAARQRGFDVSVETDLHSALERLARNGALEVLVEAGPELTEAVLASGLWDEHVIIAQSAGSDGEDIVSIRYPQDADLLQEKDSHVLRNY